MNRSHFALAGVLTLIGLLLVFVHPLHKEEPILATEAPPDQVPRGYVCYRAKGPIVIDGKIDESAWADAPWSESFRDIEGDKKPEPRLRTRMKMLWDDEALYIAAELEEPHVWGAITKHDEVIFHDHDFEVFIDPDGDGHNYGEMEMNVLNTTWDLLLTRPYKDGGRAVDSWEIKGMKTGVHIDGTINDPRDVDRGWTLEIVLPWKSLNEIAKVNYPPRDGDQWRINFSRVEWDMDIVGNEYRKVPKRAEHNWVWSPQGVIDMHRPERWGIVQFSTAAPGTATFHPDPAQPARDYLHRVYYAEKVYHKQTSSLHPGAGRYANSLTALRSVGALPERLSSPRIEATRNTFEADVELRRPDGVREHWRITNDAWFTKVEIPPSD